jgi:hydrogenase expression/formation protein HypE
MRRPAVPREGRSRRIEDLASACPIPILEYPTIVLAHGGGGRLMHQLIERMFVPAFQNPLLAGRHDGAVLDVVGRRLAFTTDSYVVRPLFFPGGDIGTLAVNGTVNDLAMCGARALYLSAGFILEEGLPMDTLWRVVCSMQQAAAAAGVQLVTGDTKVVDRGKGDRIFINTAGIGVIDHGLTIAPGSVRAGDAVLLSGDIGRHGMAIMAVREGLGFESTIESDCAAVGGLVMDLLAAGIQVHCLRDLTRGGLASALVEIAEAARAHIDIDEVAIPVREDVRGACELLGLDPMYVANEGRFVGFVPPRDAERALAILRAHPLGEGACLVGGVMDGGGPRVTMRSAIGVRRIVDMLSGEQLPRIC